ncbi:MAG: hypothetical protein ACREQ5_07810 [Candidatus Dormibacteria bacterium]
MIDLDVFQQKWAEQDRKLDLGIRLNRQLLMSVNLNRVRSPLRRFAFFLGLEALVGLAVTVILGQFIYEHWAAPRFLLPAAVLDVWVIANVAASIRQMVMALHINYDRPMADIQKQLESLQVLRIRVTQWALLTGQVVWWVPCLIVVLKGCWGVDAYRAFGGTVLAVNVLFGLAIIPPAIWMSRKFDGRWGGSSIIERLMRVLAGYNLNAATDFLKTLSEFADDKRDS